MIHNSLSRTEIEEADSTPNSRGVYAWGGITSNLVRKILKKKTNGFKNKFSKISQYLSRSFTPFT